LAILTILAVAVTDLIALVRAHAAQQTVRYIQLAWWLIITVAVALWVRPEGWAGAVAALVAAAWYFIAERWTSYEEQPPQSGFIAALYPWSAVGLVVLLAGFTWLDIALLSDAVPAGLMWLAIAVFLTQTGNRVTRCVSLLSRGELDTDTTASRALSGGGTGEG